MENNTTPSTEIDLLEELSKATEPKPENNATHESVRPPIDLGEDAGSSSDFDPQPPHDREPEATDPDTQEFNAEELTDLIIDGVETANEFILPLLHLKTMDVETRQMLKSIAQKYKQAKSTKNKVIEFDEKEQEAMELYIDHEDYVEMIPFSAKEKKKLRGPLEKVLAKVNFKASPENALIAVSLIVMLPRLLPLLKGFIKKPKP